MQPAHTPADHFFDLRRLVAGRLLSVGLFAAGCLALGRPELALAVFLGGMAVVAPEVFQYFAARSLSRRGDAVVGAARGIHMAKLLLTVGAALGLALALDAAGIGVGGLLAGMVAAFGGYLALVRR